MKSLFSKYIWLQLILSILLLFGGTLIIVFAATGKENILKDALNIISAVILFLFGAFAILAAFVFEPNKIFTTGLLYGSASIALGIFLCTGKFAMIDYLVYILAIFFIVAGAIELVKGIILATQKEKKIGYMIITFVIAAIFITGGILALIFTEINEKVSVVFCVLAGALLFVAGVYELVMGVKVIISVRNKGERSERKSVFRRKKEYKQEEPQQEEIKELDYTENQ